VERSFHPVRVAPRVSIVAASLVMIRRSPDRRREVMFGHVPHV
jgi:hypothetical protein